MLDPWQVQLLLGLACGLLTGAVAGSLAGFAGIGGGLIYVPVFLLVLPHDDGTLSLQIFASLVAVTMTGFFSARAHWRLNHVRTDMLMRWLPALVAGCAFGLWTTLHIHESLLLAALAALNFWVAQDYIRSKQASVSAGASRWLKVLPLPIGYVSGSLGIGGGTMLVPLFRRWVSLREAVGTSSACGMAMAAMAVAVNLIAERSWDNVVLHHLPMLAGIWLGLLLIVPAASSKAAAFHDHVDETTLRYMLGIVFAVVGALLLMRSLLH